jgi:hypothetical protein
MRESVRELLAKTRIILYPDEYTVVSIPRSNETEARRFLCGLEPFSSVTFDEAEVSVVLRTKEWKRLKASFTGSSEEGPYCLFTFDIVLDLSVVGFLNVVSKRLADEGISIYALSTFLRDHILVKKEDAEKASEILQHLIEQCRD